MPLTDLEAYATTVASNTRDRTEVLSFAVDQADVKAQQLYTRLSKPCALSQSLHERTASVCVTFRIVFHIHMPCKTQGKPFALSAIVISSRQQSVTDRSLICQPDTLSVGNSKIRQAQVLE